MSGPVDNADNDLQSLGISAIEVKEGRTAQVGNTAILRVLPTKRRRTIGPWCFVDLMAPDDVANPPPLEIGPHPHIGLSTVTWLFAGAALHSDSLGSEQLIRPGELNLMTAGRGIAHAEEGVEAAADVVSGMMGAQMWLAQPEATRHGSSSFQHLAELPEVDLGTATGRLLIGQAGDEVSAAEVDHPTLGLDLVLHAATELTANPGFEYGIIPISGPAKVEDAIVEPGALAVVPPGYEALRLESSQPGGHLLVIGGEPLGAEIQMWWNFVARSRYEITDAWRAWQDNDEGWFGPVPSSLPRIDAPRPFWLKE